MKPLKSSISFLFGIKWQAESALVCYWNKLTDECAGVSERADLRIGQTREQRNERWEEKVIVQQSVAAAANQQRHELTHTLTKVTPLRAERHQWITDRVLQRQRVWACVCVCMSVWECVHVCECNPVFKTHIYDIYKLFSFFSAVTFSIAWQNFACERKCDWIWQKWWNTDSELFCQLANCLFYESFYNIVWYDTARMKIYFSCWTDQCLKCVC